MMVTKRLPKQMIQGPLTGASIKRLTQQIMLPPILSLDTRFYSTTLSTKKGLPSFFTYNSGRARRKRKLRLLLSQNGSKGDSNSIYNAVNGNSGSNDTTIDNRTVMDILFPDPFKDIPKPEEPKMPRTFAKWKEVLSLAWRDYKETWVGFTSSKGILVQDQNDAQQQDLAEQRKATIETKKKEVLRNMKRNRRFLQVTAMKIRHEVRTRTGITSMEDVKQYAADAMRLATECLQQFMSGYRKGRDDEVEKMLTQYFQQLEQTAIQQAEKKPRRKIKRRILNRYHSMY